MRKTLIMLVASALVLSTLVISCSDQPRKPTNNLEVVIHEYPNALVYSEKPDKDLQDWIILKDNQIFSVHVSNMAVEYTYLLSLRYDPNNIPVTQPIDTTKVVSMVDTARADTTIKGGTSKH